MSVILALMGALVVGSGDFLGGYAGRRATPRQVLAVAFPVGVVIIAAVSALYGGNPGPRDWLWGAVSGLGGAWGVFALYRGFSVAPVGIVSPVAAVTGGALPAVFGFLAGERPSALVASGILLGAVAIGLVSSAATGPTVGSARAGVVHGLAAGSGFAVLLVFLSLPSPDAGLWPVVASRAASAAVVLAAATTAGRVCPPRAAMPASLGAGVLTVAGNALYVLALEGGSLATVSILYSLFPAATVILAWVFFRERLSRLQMVGVVAAVVATMLIAGG